MYVVKMKPSKPRCFLVTTMCLLHALASSPCKAHSRGQAIQCFWEKVMCVHTYVHVCCCFTQQVT